ncbi:hypothetical protein OBBRIDRAFT_592935 [Obba rivulosa]|uniref:NACHT domain-containing protein n=1 Tax=Obba rivulosa TaxID=1052685 RepID=A0A8E2B1L1_9APHY|nr:hypothetical protein OBBRIDRAFT_592935 [Obba rivulosa]
MISIGSEMRRWLSPPDPSTNHNAASKSHREGTAKWFIEGEAFKEWKTTGSLLWIHGKPGSGKSILCSRIIEDVERMCKTQWDTILAYFYCDFQDPDKQNIRGLLSSLLVHFSTHSDHCAKIFSRLYSEYNDGSRQPSDAALTKCLKDMLSAQGATYIIIDALDECPISPGIPSQREQILQLIKELVELHLSDLHICITSRPEPDIQRILEPLTDRHISLHVESGQEEDIALYVRSTMNSDNSFKRWNEAHKVLTIKTLSEKADGMFRWVFCQLELLRRCIPATVQRTLNSLPKSLDETYQRMLEHIDESNWECAHRILQCLAVSARPLLIGEIAEVLAVDFDDATIPRLKDEWRSQDPITHILSICSTLVTVDMDAGEVRFAHFSVQEYLTSERLASEEKNSIKRFYVHDELAHVVLVQACLSTLLQLDGDTVQNTVWSYPLACYAAEHWVHHAQFKDVSSHIQDAMQLLFHPAEKHVAAWIWIYDMDGSYSTYWFYGNGRAHTAASKPAATPLYYAAQCGFTHLTRHLLVIHNQDANTEGAKYGTALQAASFGGHLKVVQFLVEARR